jgi:multimeric flavodoxin WrbA
VTERESDLVVIGSPAWWLSTNVPIRSFLESETAGRLGAERGGGFLDGIHFRYTGVRCGPCCR